MNEVNVSKIEQDIPQNIKQLDTRLKHIEQIAESVEKIAEKGFETAEKYILSKAEQERLDAEFEDRQHKRSVILLFAVILLIFLLVMTAFIKEQYELVKVILGSAFAVGSGAGIASLFRNSKRKQ